MLQADPSKVSQRAKKRGLPQVGGWLKGRDSGKQCGVLDTLGVCHKGISSCFHTGSNTYYLSHKHTHHMCTHLSTLSHTHTHTRHVAGYAWGW